MYEIWKYLNDADQYIRSFEEFKIEFENPEMQKKLFDGMNANGLNPGDSFEGFQSQYFDSEKNSRINIFADGVDQETFNNTNDEEDLEAMIKSATRKRGFVTSGRSNHLLEMMSIQAPNGNTATVLTDQPAGKKLPARIKSGITDPNAPDNTTINKSELNDWMNANQASEQATYIAKKFGVTLRDLNILGDDEEAESNLLKGLDTAVNLAVSKVATSRGLTDYGISASQVGAYNIADQINNIDPNELNAALTQEANSFLEKSGYIEGSGFDKEKISEMVQLLVTRKGAGIDLLRAHGERNKAKQTAIINGVNLTAEEYTEAANQRAKKGTPTQQRTYELNKQLDVLRERSTAAEGDTKIAIDREIAEIEYNLKNLTEKKEVVTGGYMVPNTSTTVTKNTSYQSFTDSAGNIIDPEAIEKRKAVLTTAAAQQSGPNVTMRESLEYAFNSNVQEEKLWISEGLKKTVIITRADIEEMYKPRTTFETLDGGVSTRDADYITQNLLPNLGFDYNDGAPSYTLSLYDLYEADKRMSGPFGQRLGPEKNNADYNSYKNWRTKIDTDGLALNELYLFNSSPENLKKQSLADFGYSAIEASGLVGTPDETKLKFGTNRNKKDVIQNFAGNYNASNSEAIDEGKLAPITFNKKQEKALARTMADNIIEGTGAMVPIIAKFAAIELATGGMATSLGITTTIRALSKSTSLWKKASAGAYALGYEELKTQLAGFKTGSGVAFAGTNMLLPSAKLKFLQGFPNAFLNKVVKGGPAGAIAGEVALVTEAFIGQFTHDENFQHFLDINFRDVGADEIFERMAVSAATFSIIGATHLKAKDVSYKAYRKETAAYSAQKFILDRQINLIEQVNSGKMTLEEAKPLGITEKMLGAENVAALKDMQTDVGNLLDARLEQQKWDPESPTFEADAAAYIKSTFKNAGLEMGKNGDFKVEFVDSFEGLEGGKNGDTAKWVPEQNKIQFVKSKFTSGKLGHEIFHAGLKAFFHKKPAELRQFNEGLVNIITKALNIGDGVQGDAIAAGIKKTYGLDLRKKLDKNLAAEELMANLVEVFANPVWRANVDALQSRGLMHEIKNSIYNFAERKGFDKIKPKIESGQDLIDFLGRFAYNVNTGKDVSKQIERLSDIDLFGNSDRFFEYKNTMESKEGSPEFKKLEKDVFSEADRYYEEYKDIDMNSAALMVGYAFRPLVEHQANMMYRDIPGWKSEGDLLIDEVATGMGETRKSGFENVADRELVGQSIPGLVKSYNPEGGAKLTTYIYGQLKNRIMSVQEAKFPNLGKTVSLEKDAFENIVDGEPMVDLSSPERSARTSRKNATKALGLSDALAQKTESIADRILNSKLPDLTAKQIGKYNLKEGGSADVLIYENGTAKITVDGVDMKLKVRSIGDIPKFLKSKGYSIDGTFEKAGNFREQQISALRGALYNDLQQEAGPSANKGMGASPQYAKFIEKSYALFKNYISQSAVNKRFEQFNEPILDATGKQKREATAQGNALFKKKNITESEWFEYFAGDGSVRVDGRRRALLETIAEEIGFDAIAERVFDAEKRKQIESRQAELSNELVEGFAALIGKQLDRAPGGSKLIFSSKATEEMFAGFIGAGEANSIQELRRILNLASTAESGFLQQNHPDVYQLLERMLAEELGEGYANLVKKADASFKAAITPVLDPNSERTPILKPPKELGKGELKKYEVALGKLTKVMPNFLLFRTGGNYEVKSLGAFIGTVFGYNGLPPKLNTTRFNEKFFDFDTSKGERFGKNYDSFIKNNPEVKKAWEKFNEAVDAGDGSFAFRTSNLRLIKEIAKINKETISNIEKIKKIEAFKNTTKGKQLLKGLEASDAFFDAITLSIDALAKNDPEFIDNITPLFLANQSTNLFRMFSSFSTIQLKSGGIDYARNEHLKSKHELTSNLFKEIYNGTLTAERFEQLKQGWRSIIGEAEMQKEVDKILEATFDGYLPTKLSLQGELMLGKKWNEDIAIQNLKSLYNFRKGKTEYDLLINEIAEGLVKQLDIKYDQAKELIENPSERITMSSKDLTKEFDDMLSRKTKLGGFVSASRAAQLGAKKGRYDLYIPPNAEDFAGMLYKLYGKGKQGNDDMALAREALLLPFERGENAISTYRQQISQKFKDFNKNLKNFNIKFDKESVAKIEDSGFTVDQALRVWIWDKAGHGIPDITPKEQKGLVDIVSKNPKLLASALAFKNMFGAGRPYPEPKGDWYASNVKLDAHRYINKGARPLFLEEFITNADQIFTPEFFAKAEAGFGKNYVKNLQEMLESMKTGQSRTDNMPEFAKIGMAYLNGAVGNIMFLNGRSSVLQTISMTNFVNWSDNNVLAVGKTLADPKKFGKTFMELMNSDFLKQRRDGLEINIDEAEIAKSLANSKNPYTLMWGKLMQLGYTPTKFADSFAIAAGGTPFYINRIKTYEKEGFTTQEARSKAFDDFRMLAETHQQSSRQDKVSNIQKGPMGRFLYSFSGAPFQMAREQKKSALNMINGRGDFKTELSKFIYYGAVQNLLFTALQQGIFALAFDDEDDEEVIAKNKETRVTRLANSMLDTSLRSSGLPGALIAMSKNAIKKYLEQNEKGYKGDMGQVVGEVFNLSPALGSKYRTVYSGLNSRKYLLHTKKGAAEVEAKHGFLENPLMQANAKIIGGVTNLPINRLMIKAANLETTITGNEGAQAWQRVALAAGWDKWSLGFYDQKQSTPSSTLSRSEQAKQSYAKRKLAEIERQNQQLDSMIKSKKNN
jgi:hypothetical protein